MPSPKGMKSRGKPALVQSSPGTRDGKAGYAKYAICFIDIGCEHLSVACARRVYSVAHQEQALDLESRRIGEGALILAASRLVQMSLIVSI
jgi:hypothetical protein